VCPQTTQPNVTRSGRHVGLDDALLVNDQSLRLALLGAALTRLRSMPLGRITGRPVTTWSLAISTHNSAIAVNQRRRHLFRRSVEAEFSW
jgi:hypothetical protein